VSASEGSLGTTAGHVFLESVREIRARLSDDHSPEARNLLREAGELDTELQTWASERPSNDTRLAVIQRLMALRQRVTAYQSPRKGP
jgi:hypothetical protein